ncbi:MAG: hypothetical protein ACYC4L_09865 [Chloroflexota bacterium]
MEDFTPGEPVRPSEPTPSVQRPGRRNFWSWAAILPSLLPLWLLSLAITVEGFPSPPITLEVALGALAGAVAIGLLLLWRRLTTGALLFYSLMPLTLMAVFDDISTAYKTPFILVCALVLTVGAVIYQRNHARRWVGPVLPLFAVLVLVLASHVTTGYWQMVGALDFGQCFPDAPGCAPLTGGATPWWALIFTW